MNSFCQSNIAAAMQQIGRAQAEIMKARDPANLRDGGALMRAKWALEEAANDLENAIRLESMTADEEEKR